jgi:hypothetical protein
VELGVEFSVGQLCVDVELGVEFSDGQLCVVVELGVEFSVGQLCVDVELKGTAYYFDDINYAIIKVTDWEGKLQNRNGKTTRQSNTTHIV